MVDMINILIVDEMPIIRYAIKNILAGQSHYNIVGEAGSVSEAIALTREKKLDIITTDLSFSSDDILRLSSFAMDKGTRMMAFTMLDGWDTVESFVKAGGNGFVSKKSPVSDIRSAFDAVSSGKTWISPRLRKVTIQDEPGEAPSVLSKREIEIATLVAKGLTSKQIADQLCLSIRTIENHRHRIFKRLGIRRSAQLVRYALKNKLLHTNETR